LGKTGNRSFESAAQHFFQQRADFLHSASPRVAESARLLCQARAPDEQLFKVFNER